jgi:metal-responsive CopG/Arc/MetJ family transcriptional regulator
MTGPRANTPRRAFRMQMFLTSELAAAVDDYRFAKRIPSRSAAIRQLLQSGMSATSTHTERGSRH